MSPVPFSPITLAPTANGSSSMPGYYSGSAVAPPGGAGHSIFDYQVWIRKFWVWVTTVQNQFNYLIKHTIFECSPVWRCRALCLWRRRRSWRSRARTTWTSSSPSTRARSRSCKVGQLDEGGGILVWGDNKCLNVWKCLQLWTLEVSFLHIPKCEATELDHEIYKFW